MRRRNILLTGLIAGATVAGTLSTIIVKKGLHRDIQKQIDNSQERLSKLKVDLQESVQPKVTSFLSKISRSEEVESVEMSQEEAEMEININNSVKEVESLEQITNKEDENEVSNA